MYEPIRTKSVQTAVELGIPQRSRDEELDIRLSGDLNALLTVTDELRALTPEDELDEAAWELTEHVTRLRGGNAPLRAAPSELTPDAEHVDALHHRAHTLAGHAVVIATYRNDEAVMALANWCVRIHAEALGLTTG